MKLLSIPSTLNIVVLKYQLHYCSHVPIDKGSPESIIEIKQKLFNSISAGIITSELYTMTGDWEMILL